MRVIRVWFEKHEEARFISHLDLNRYMPRAIRRADIPVWYTEGFNKHLYINFAVPLSLGYESRNDCFEIKIMDDDFSDEQVLQNLINSMPLGIKITKVTVPCFSFKHIKYAQYEVYLELSCDYIERIKELFNRDEIIVTKKTKSGEKKFNIAQNIAKIRIEEFENRVMLSALLPAGCSENVNPSLLIQAINNELMYETDYVKIIRKGFFTQDFKEFK